MTQQISDLNKSFQNGSYDARNIMKEFSKNILLNVFHNNLQYLVQESKLVKFSKDIWTYRPDIYSADYYDEFHFYPVILLVNNLGSRYQFESSNFSNNRIISPSKEAIIKLLTLKIEI